MALHYGKYIQDQGLRPRPLCGQWSGGFGQNSPVTEKKDKVNCKKCIKKLKEMDNK